MDLLSWALSASSGALSGQKVPREEVTYFLGSCWSDNQEIERVLLGTASTALPVTPLLILWICV